MCFLAAVNLLPFLEFYADPVNDCKVLREDFQATNGLVVVTKAEKYNCKMFWVQKFGEGLDPTTELSKKTVIGVFDVLGLNCSCHVSHHCV